MKTLTLVIAWTWIAVPLGWGVYQSVQKSMPLFNGQPQPTALSSQGQATEPNPELNTSPPH
ncbi:MAG: hypothetical protein H7Z17_09595 [Fuerstia sp.]|nr:hypothetical protein [Fuerstiella sp.]